MNLSKILKKFAYALPVGVAFVDEIGFFAVVDGVSMQPSLNPVGSQADVVLLNKWVVRNYEVKRGDIISLICPKNPDQKYIKRVVGLEGDMISTPGYKTRVVVVPEGHCWVEGDHIEKSFDSNNFGPVALGLVTAKATHIIWPPSRWRSLDSQPKHPKKKIKMPS